MNFLIFAKKIASLAQLVEQLIRNEQVVGSSPIGGSLRLIFSVDPDNLSFVLFLLETYKHSSREVVPRSVQMQ